MKRFVLSDERVINSYGFRVLTAGINMERFNNNPICLNDHKNSTKDVLGIWEDIKKDEHTLTATPKFDTEDADGKEVVRKVKSGTLKGCSIGITFEPDYMLMIDGVLTLTKCELLEASICAVPSNSAAIVLYNKAEQPLTETEVKTLCHDVKNQFKQIKTEKTMKELTAHLQLDDNANETAILNAVKGIEAKLTASQNENASLKAENESLKQAEKTRQQAELNAELEAAVKDGRLDEAGKAPFLELAHDSAMKLLQSLPKRTPVNGRMSTEDSELSKYDKMTWDEMDKGNHLAHLKAVHPDYFRERYQQEFGKS